MVDKTYALAIRYGQPGVLAENVLHVHKFTAGDPVQADFLAIANAWKETIRSSMNVNVAFTDFIAEQVLGDGVTYDPTTCRQVGGTLFTGPLTAPLAGTVAGDAMPPQAAVTVRVATGLRGRSYRTHVQVGGLSEGSQAAGVPTAGYVTGLQGQVDLFVAVYKQGGTSPNWRWCTFSRGIASGCYPDPDLRHHPLRHIRVGDPGLATADVTSATVGTVVSSMKSRAL